MSSIHEQILSAAVSALASLPGIDGRVFRSRVEAVARGETPCVIVQPGGEETTVFNPSVDENRMLFSVELMVRGDPYDQIADPYVVDVHRLLYGSSDLAALVAQLRRKSRAFEANEADHTAGSVTTTYEARYLSAAGDMTESV